MLIAQTEAEELPTVSVNPYFSFGPVTKAVSEMKQHLNEFSNEELVKVAKAGEEEEEERLRSTTPRTMQMFTGFLVFLQSTKCPSASWTSPKRDCR